MHQDARHHTAGAIVEPGQQHPHQEACNGLRGIEVDKPEHQSGEEDGRGGTVSLEQLARDGPAEHQFLQHRPQKSQVEDAAPIAIHLVEGAFQPIGQEVKHRHQALHQHDGRQARHEGPPQVGGGYGRVDLPVVVQVPLLPQVPYGEEQHQHRAGHLRGGSGLVGSHRARRDELPHQHQGHGSRAGQHLEQDEHEE